MRKLWAVRTAIFIALIFVGGVVLQAGELIQRVYTDKARYSPGETVKISVALDNRTGTEWSGQLTVTVYHLGQVVSTGIDPITVNSLQPFQTATEIFDDWPLSGADFTGYYVHVAAGTVDSGATAVDVSSSWFTYPRYGYLHRFNQNQVASEAAVKRLGEDYHLSALQFYDWMWRHENVTPSTALWLDWLGVLIKRESIEDLIDAAHGMNMRAMPYFMLYAAMENYQSESPQVDPAWGLYYPPGLGNIGQAEFDLGDNNSATGLRFFNPANQEWQTHIFKEVADPVPSPDPSPGASPSPVPNEGALGEFDFDGVHWDQMGLYWEWQGIQDTETGNRFNDYSGNPVTLSETFSQELGPARRFLDNLNILPQAPAEGYAMTFNMVNGGINVKNEAGVEVPGALAWGADNVLASNDSQFHYSELWDNSETYESVYNWVRHVRERTDKALVLAAYVNFEEEWPVTRKLEAEAEAETLSGSVTRNGVTLYGNNVADFGTVGDYVEFEFNLPETNRYVFAFRYATPDAAVKRNVYVDGNSTPYLADMDFPSTGSFTTWRVSKLVFPTLSAGTHTIRLSFAAGNAGSLDLDNMYWYADPAFLYEAEDAALTGSLSIQSNHAGFSGNGFVAPLANTGSKVTFSVDVPAAGEYGLVFHYANATGTVSTKSLYVNGTDIEQIAFPNAANWSTWLVAGTTVNLNQGANTIAVAKDASDSHGMNLDHIYIYNTKGHIPLYEAETATRATTVGEATDHSDHTGLTAIQVGNETFAGGFVDGFDAVGDYIEFRVFAPQTGDYGLNFRYAIGHDITSGMNGAASLYIDGSQIQYRHHGYLLFVNKAWGWDRWHAEGVKAYLTAGWHDIRLQIDSDDIIFGSNPVGINLDSMYLSFFDEDSVRLSNAAFAASGAFHIEMGEGDQMLGHPYFPNEGRQMTDALLSSMKDYYNFITAYEELLFGNDIVYGDNGIQWMALSDSGGNLPLNGKGAAGHVWVLSNHHPDYEVIHLINLLKEDDLWRNYTDTPDRLEDLTFTYYLGPGAIVNGVYLASPDTDNGKTLAITSYSTGSDSKGSYITFTLSSLEYWNMIYIDRAYTIPGNGIYEAEHAVKTGVGTGSYDWTGYTGTGFVVDFYDVYDSVSFVVSAETAGAYDLNFHYATSDYDSTRTIYVDGEPAGIVAFPNTGGWGENGSQWTQTQTLTVQLSEGVHDIVVLCGGTDIGAVNLDHLVIEEN